MSQGNCFENPFENLIGNLNLNCQSKLIGGSEEQDEAKETTNQTEEKKPQQKKKAKKPGKQSGKPKQKAKTKTETPATPNAEAKEVSQALIGEIFYAKIILNRMQNMINLVTVISLLYQKSPAEENEQ